VRPLQYGSTKPQASLPRLSQAKTNSRTRTQPCGFFVPLEPSYRTPQSGCDDHRSGQTGRTGSTTMVCRGRRPPERHFYGSMKPFTGSPRVRAQRPTSSFFLTAIGCCLFLTVKDNHQKARSRPLRLSPSPDAWGNYLPSGLLPRVYYFASRTIALSGEDHDGFLRTTSACAGHFSLAGKSQHDHGLIS
jgi:hypothetical protein